MAEWGVTRAENAQLQETSNPEIPHRPDGIQVDGQTFAATELFVLSCSPLLKARLLQSLSATREELDSLEPLLSATWDQWYRAVIQARLQEREDRQQLPPSGQTGGQMPTSCKGLGTINEEFESSEAALSAVWDQWDRAVGIV
ncbi:hypothetical protein ACEPAH_4609 [Sanghuangporus vaninii]